MTSSEKTLKFAKKYGSQIASAINNSNIFFETAIAQACLESGYGTSPIAVCCNNFKGIAGRPIYSSGKNGKWAIFPTPLDCFKSYATFINNLQSDKVINGKRVQVLRYEKALNAKTPQDQIYQLVYAGYCTSSFDLSCLTNELKPSKAFT